MSTIHSTESSAENNADSPLMLWNIEPPAPAAATALAAAEQGARTGPFARVKTFGILNIKDYGRLLDEITGSPFWQPGMNILVDDRSLDFSRITLDDLRLAVENRARVDELIGGGKTAVLVDNSLSFGRARQFELLTDGKRSSQIRVFQDEQEALRWLAQG